MPSAFMNRRTFLTRASALLAVGALPGGVAVRLDPASPLEHPDPRPGITAEHVLAAAALGASPSETVLAAYDSARSFPAVFDGLACGCGCTDKGMSHRSLLSCFESLQPTGCRSCQLEAELVARMAKQDATLAEIRAAVDKKFG